MKHLILVCIISLAFLSCYKKDQSLPFIFAGKVTDVNGNPVAGANVNLSAYYRGTVLSGGGYSEIAKTKTDQAGGFKVSFGVDSTANKLMIQIFADNYFPYFNENISQSDIQNKVLAVNPLVHKLAVVKISFNNGSPVSSADEFSVFHNNALFGPSFYTLIERQFTGGTFNEPEHRYTGSNIQGYELSKTKGDAYTVINWTVKKNGVGEYRTDSLFIAGGAQGNYHINY